MIKEAQDIRNAALIWSELYRKRAGFFQSTGTYLALTSGIVATIAGGTGLIFTATAGASIALSAGVIAAISSTLGTAGRTEKERGAATANTTLADAARVFSTTVAPYYSKDDSLHAFRLLLDQRDKVVENSPIEGWGTVRKAAKAFRNLEAKPESKARLDLDTG